MTGGRLVILAGLLWAVPAWAERAQPRQGGEERAKASSPASERHAGGAADRQHAQPSGRGFASPRFGESERSTLTEAQRRHPRAGTGTGGRRHGRFVSDPFFFRPYRYGFGYYGYPGYGYDGWGYWPYRYGYGYGYGGGYGYAPYRHYGSRTGSLRMLVDPEQTKVFVDGYYTGVADDFDGIFQRLHLSPGRHDITLKLEGYRTYHVRVYVPYDQTVKIRHEMVRGTGEDHEEGAVGRPAGYARYEEGEEEARLEDQALSGERGTLRLEVMPADASVYVDGEFRGVARQLDSLRLPAGRHHVEVVRPGYQTEERELEIRPGRETELTVDLEKR